MKITKEKLEELEKNKDEAWEAWCEAREAYREAYEEVYWEAYRRLMRMQNRSTKMKITKEKLDELLKNP